MLRESLLSPGLSAIRLDEHLFELLGAAVETGKSHRGQIRKTGARSKAVQANLLAKLDRARAMLEDDPRNPKLDRLAAESGLSKFHLVRLFRKVYGAPPAAHARRLRMERAAQLLRFTLRPVTDIAMDLGYEHLSAFSKAFRSYSGASPAAFRAALK